MMFSTLHRDTDVFLHLTNARKTKLTKSFGWFYINNLSLHRTTGPYKADFVYVYPSVLSRLNEIDKIELISQRTFDAMI